MAKETNPIIFKLTDAGKLAALDAKGETPKISIHLTHLAIGKGRYDTSGKERALKSEIKRVSLVSDSVEVVSNTLRFSASIEASAITPIYELGLFTEAGLLFALASSVTEPLFVIHPNIVFVGSFGIALGDADAGNITVSIDPNGTLSAAIMAQHLAAKNPHPQYLNVDHLDVSKDPHPQYVTLNRFQLLLDTMLPVGYLHHTHEAVNPKPRFDALLGVSTAWRRLAGKIIVGTDPDDPYIKDVGLSLGQKGMTENAGDDRPHVYPLYTTNVFERYNPNDHIETVWTVNANKTAVNEGEGIRFTVSANNLPDGQILKWTAKEGALNAGSNDITSPAKTTSGTVILKNGAANIEFMTTPDNNKADPQMHVRLTVGVPANLSINVPIVDAGRTEKLIHITRSTLRGLILDEYFKLNSGDYPKSTDKVRFIVNPYVDVVGLDSAVPAIDAGKNWPAGSEIIVENRGRILGHGGSGGRSARFSQQRGSELPVPISDDQYLYDLTKPALVGENGGTAIRGNIKVENYGLIAGGGGGGGGAGIFYADSQSGYMITVSSVKKHLYIGGGGGSGGGAPLGKRYPNLHTLAEFNEHFNPTGVVIPDHPADGNYVTHVQMNAKTASFYNIAGNSAGSRGKFNLPTVTTTVENVSMFNVPRWVDEAKGIYYWQEDSTGVMQQSQNATIDTAGQYGYDVASTFRMQGIPPNIRTIPVSSIKQNHGGAGGAIGENGSDGVMPKYYNFDGDVAENKIVKKLLPAKGGLAGLVKEGNVVITNHSGGSTKGR